MQLGRSGPVLSFRGPELPFLSLGHPCEGSVLLPGLAWHPACETGSSESERADTLSGLCDDSPPCEISLCCSFTWPCNASRVRRRDIVALPPKNDKRSDGFRRRLYLSLSLPASRDAEPSRTLAAAFEPHQIANRSLTFVFSLPIFGMWGPHHLNRFHRRAPRVHRVFSFPSLLVETGT